MFVTNCTDTFINNYTFGENCPPQKKRRAIVVYVISDSNC